MYTYWIFSQNGVSKNVSCQEIDLKTGPGHWKVKILGQPNKGGLYSDSILGEHIMKKAPNGLSESAF